MGRGGHYVPKSKTLQGRAPWKPFLETSKSCFRGGRAREILGIAERFFKGTQKEQWHGWGARSCFPWGDNTTRACINTEIHVEIYSTNLHLSLYSCKKHHNTARSAMSNPGRIDNMPSLQKCDGYFCSRTFGGFYQGFSRRIFLDTFRTNMRRAIPASKSAQTTAAQT